MRGAQPATSAGARLFAGSPISGALTASWDGIEIKKTRSVISCAQTSNAHFVDNEHFAPNMVSGPSCTIQTGLERLLSRFSCAAIREIAAIRARVREGLF
jgi:hypothetical protein